MSNLTTGDSNLQAAKVPYNERYPQIDGTNGWIDNSCQLTDADGYPKLARQGYSPVKIMSTPDLGDRCQGNMETCTICRPNDRYSVRRSMEKDACRV